MKKLDSRKQPSDSEADWLLKFDFDETLEIHWQQEEARKAELEFLALKSKYQVDSYSETSISSELYPILKRLDSGEELFNRQCKWLKKQSLNHLLLIDLDHKARRLFTHLKNKYKATQYHASDPSSRLFLILRNLEASDSRGSGLSENLGLLNEARQLQITEKDVEWLLEEGLIETAEIAKQAHFKNLKIKYRIVGQLAINPFYKIMIKLEREERLDPKQVIQLIEEGHLSRDSEITRITD